MARVYNNKIPIYPIFYLLNGGCNPTPYLFESHATLSLPPGVKAARWAIGRFSGFRAGAVWGLFTVRDLGTMVPSSGFRVWSPG